MQLTAFELDHPATQGWKLERLKTAEIAVPPIGDFAPVDLKRVTLTEALSAGGFSFEKRSFFVWVGTVPHLREHSIQLDPAHHR
jgi:O-methyltransferase involved in polyketide biosynthesis